MKKLSLQKIFNFISFLFILSCCLFYGIRFIKLYSENHKIEVKEENSLVKLVRENNHSNENFKSINGKNYFIGKEDKNYLMYSNILFRIIKVNNDGSITAISDSSLSGLAFGKNKIYKESQVYRWLNTSSDDEYSGILERVLNKKEEYLDKNEVCLDVIDEIANTSCSLIDKDNYIGLLSMEDYLNIGSKDSYLNNGQYYYLSNSTNDNKLWYVSDEGILKQNNGIDIYGVRPVITIKANIDYVLGDGSKDNPYKIEKDNGLFGSYVKLGEDIWRIYQVNEEEVRLMLNDYLKVNGEVLEYRYSGSNSYFDDYSRNSIAYYLNNTYLNSLSYKDKIKEVNWSNGYYNSGTDYDYKNALETKINSRVTLMSIGNIFLNGELTNYYTMTGTGNKSYSVYMMDNEFNIYTKQVGQKINIVPVISLDKNLLTKGNGTVDSPFEME